MFRPPEALALLARALGTTVLAADAGAVAEEEAAALMELEVAALDAELLLEDAAVKCLEEAVTPLLVLDLMKEALVTAEYPFRAGAEV